MPNRILRASICESPTLAKLSDGAERLFYRLLTRADEHGVFPAEPQLVRCACLPLVATTDETVLALLDELGMVGLVQYFRHKERVYGSFVTWKVHNRIRSLNHPHPDVPATTCNCLTTIVSGSLSIDSKAMTIAANANTNANTNTNTNRASQHAQVAGPRIGDDEGKRLQRRRTKSAIDFADQEVWEHVEAFKAACLEANPDHTCSDADAWKKDRVSWYRTLKAKKQLAHRIIDAARKGPQFGFVVTSPLEAYDKLNRIETAMKGRQMSSTTAPRYEDEFNPSRERHYTPEEIAQMRAEEMAKRTASVIALEVVSK